MSNIRQVSNRNEQVLNNASVSAGGSKNSSEVRLDSTKNNISAGFSIQTTTGSPKAELQVYFGDDANGNPIWITVASTTNASGVLNFDGSAEKARVKVSETGATSGLSDIYAWVSGRAV